MTAVSWCRWDCRAELSTQLLLVVEPAPALVREQVLALEPVLVLEPGPVWAHRRRPAIVPSEQSIE